MTDKLLEKSQEAIRQIFELDGIKQVVVVDDQYRENPEDKLNDRIGSLKTVAPDKLKQIPWEIKKLKDVPWDIDEDLWSDALRKKWIDADVSEREEIDQELKKFLKKFLEPGNESNEKDEEYSSELKNLLKPINGIEFKPISFAYWEKNKAQFLSEDTCNNTLFLFDQDLTKDGGRIDEGIRIIQSLHKNYPVKCGLLSHTFEPGDEYTKWKEFASEKGIDRDHFSLISKTRLRDPLNFARMLRLTILNRHCENLKNNVSDIIKKTFEAARNDVGELDIYDFENIVFRSSSQEGIWEIDTLFRLYKIFHKEKIRLELKEKSLAGITGKVRELSSIDVGSSDEGSRDEGETWKIQRLELYEQGEHINRLHMPLESGDIFQDGAGKKYILLAQPCNLMVRSKGKRDNDFIEAVLAKINSAGASDKENSFFYELRYFDNKTGKSCFVDFRKTHTVLLCVLDLCVFNEDGAAKMKVGDSCPDAVIPAWKERFAKLQKRIKTMFERSESYKGFETGNNGKNIINLFFPKSSHAKDGLFKAKPDIKTKTLSYDCTRVERLCQPQAGAMLTRYSHYISRAAFEHDLGRTTS